MGRTPDEDLKEDLKDPECMAYFLEAQIESAQEMLRCGIITNLDVGSSASKTKHINWRSK